MCVWVGGYGCGGSYSGVSVWWVGAFICGAMCAMVSRVLCRSSVYEGCAQMWGRMVYEMWCECGGTVAMVVCICVCLCVYVGVCLCVYACRYMCVCERLSLKLSPTRKGTFSIP